MSRSLGYVAVERRRVEPLLLGQAVLMAPALPLPHRREGRSRACGGDDERGCYRAGGDRERVSWAVRRDAEVEAGEGGGAERYADEVRREDQSAEIGRPCWFYKGGQVIR